MLLLWAVSFPRICEGAPTLSPWKARLISQATTAATPNAGDWVAAQDLPISKHYIGYIEYVTELSVTPTDLVRPLGIYLGDISDSDRIYMNDALIGSTGGFPPHYQGYIDYAREYFIPSAILSTAKANILRMVVYVEYPAKKGIDLSVVRIGDHTALQRMKFFREVRWYLVRLLMPFICVVLAIVVFLSLNLIRQKQHALIYIGIALSFGLFGISRSRVTFHLFDVVTAYKILIVSNILGVTLILLHVAQAGKRARAWRCAGVFLPLMYFSSMVLFETSVNAIFTRYAPWFVVGTTMLVFSFIIAWIRRRKVGHLFAVGLGILTALGLFDTMLSTTSVRLPYLFDIGISLLVMCMICRHILAIKDSYVDISNHQILLEAQAEMATKIGQLASQVAHDIRSPLTALRAMVGQVAEVSEESRVMMRNAVQRIEDIANDLCAQQAHGQAGEAGGADMCSVQLLSSLLEPLISEKRTQHRAQLGVEIHAALDAASYGVFANVQPVEFKRVLSNLINNAVEAMAQGLVTVTVRAEDAGVVITVMDTGHGIPPDILARLMRPGATFGKAGGSGLGLYHARTTFERWGGTVALTSTMGVGTTVTLTVPRAAAPPWFVPELVLTTGQTIVIVDDDVSIHQIWQERLEVLDLAAHDIGLQHFSSGTEVVAWYQGQADTHFLCDYEFLGHPNNGLELIAQLDVADRATLVTSHYEEAPIQARCAAMGVRLIPKGLAGFVPVRVAPVAESMAATSRAPRATAPSPQRSKSETAKPTALVLDDDAGIRFVWPMEGERLGFDTITTFASMEACEAAQLDYAQFDFAFVDKNIPESTWRVDQVITHLKANGVKKVFVASGESARELLRDPLCAAVDGIIPMKIPQKLPT
ncbi:MAG: hypothetical protein HYV02_08115 [Deltaproteobacteria bacterium]|nr:hypothetical protein [Deltaproteobacteria bacterium]